MTRRVTLLASACQRRGQKRLVDTVRYHCIARTHAARISMTRYWTAAVRTDPAPRATCTCTCTLHAQLEFLGI